ncbi:TonB-dependent receptor [Rapidithrix thailandica]|uniref:TonB-dependent receptor n=1 Tax=Rapidithrix thailandica TaxID=413964 RepID=A0AAW9S465_9BACT
MKNTLSKRIIMYSKYSLYGAILQCFFFTLGLASHGNAQKVKSIKDVYLTVGFKRASIEEVIASIESNTQYRFVYQKGTVTGTQVKVTLPRKRHTIAAILTELAKVGQLGFKQVNQNINVKELGAQPEQPLVEIPLVVKDVVVSGVVTSSEDGQPLPGVTILVVGTSIGTTTDFDGKYKVTIPEGSTLLFSFIGYKSQEILVDKQSSLNVVMEPDVAQLEEVVVVGYGTQKKTSLTSAVTAVNGAELEERPTQNLKSSMQGMVPGLTIWDKGGEPGSNNISIRVRGVTTLNDNNPLVIVDGVEQPYESIDPSMIESISVLKDAASTAIYGSRAANGVLLITTKRGEEGKPRINYSGWVAFQNPTNLPEHMGTENYLRLQNLAYENRGSAPLYSEEDIQNYVSGKDRLNYPLPNDWFNSVIDNYAPMQNHTLSISGGGDYLKTMASINYRDQKGIFPNRDSKLYQLRLNNDIKINDKINLGADISYKRQQRNTTNNGNIYHYMLHGSQWAVPQYPDGSYGLSKQGHNPLMYTDPDIVGRTKVVSDFVNLNVKGTYEILEGLKFNTQVGVNYWKENQLKNWPTYEIYDYNTGALRKQRNINQLQELRYESKRMTWNNTLSYDFEVNKHSFHVMAGYSQISYDYIGMNAQGQNYYNNDLIGLGNDADKAKRNMNSSYLDEGLRSVFGRLRYSYNDKYFLETNLRYDGSSGFSEDQRYAVFPSISAAWRLSEEAFWDPLRNVVDNFKLRASYGETGNNKIYQNGQRVYYPTYENLLLNNYVFNGQLVTGVFQNKLASSELTWESTNQTNIGLDASVFNGKILFTFDWFNKLTEGILLDLEIPGIIGLEASPINAGKVRNRGWEAQVTYREKKGDFRYNVTLNLSDVQNEIVDLAGTGPYFNGEKDWMTWQEGQPINSLWGYRTDGYYTEADFDEDNPYPLLAPSAKVGDIKYVDRNEDGVLNAEDKEILGSTIPRYTYGANLGLGWKNFDVNIQFQGVAKQDMAVMGSLVEAGSWEGFTLDIAKDYWTPENPDARFPRPEKQSNRNTQPSDKWVVDGSYLRLKNLQIGYNLPEIFLDKVGMSRARVYVGGTNLFTISKLNEWGIDAEAPTGRGDFYPQLKTYTIGLNVGF